MDRRRGRTLGGRAVVLALLMTVAGCAGVGLRPLEPMGPAETRVRLDDVPFAAGDDGHCGPAALAMVLAWGGISAHADELAPRLLTPIRAGTFEHDLAGVARAEGRLVVPVAGFEAVAEEVAAGHPVIALQNLGLSWYPQWHYAVVTGYDLQSDTIFLHTGHEAHRSLALDTFRQTFERAGERALVVLPPDRLPASAAPQDVVRAAAGLERAGHADAALLAYRAVLQRFPGETGAAFGVGNALLAKGDLGGAAEAFRLSARNERLRASALNNLAHVLMLEGELAAAEQAARKALALGGQGGAAAQATLDEVRARQAG